MYTLGSEASVNLRKENESLSSRKLTSNGENANGHLSSYSAYVFLHGGRIRMIQL